MQVIKQDQGGSDLVQGWLELIVHMLIATICLFSIEFI